MAVVSLKNKVKSRNLLAGNIANPPPIYGYSLWLDGDDATTFTFSSGTRVSEWRDKSQYGRNFVQTTTANQPNRTASQGGRTGVKFAESGTIYCLTNASYDWASSAFTIFGVVDFNGGNYTAMFGRNSTASLQVGSDFGSAKFGISRVGQATSSSNLVPTGTNADVAVYKSAGISSGSVTIDVYKNGTAGSASLTLSSLGAGDKAIIGASSNPGLTDGFGNDGYICELIVYPSQLSDSDRNKVEAYLKAKWGTP